MSEAPKITSDRLNTIVTAWRQLAPNSSFGGMTLEQFIEKIQPSYDARKKITQLTGEMDDAINQRGDADQVSNDLADLVVNGIIGDPEFGPDSSFYEALGYIRKSARKSGLTRKKKPSPPVV